MNINCRKRTLAIMALVAGSSLVLGGCAVPKMLQEPFEQGVYEDILERQAEGVSIEDDKLKDLPAMTSADFERLGDTYLTRGQLSLARSKYQKALDLDPSAWRLEYKIGTILLRQNAPGDALPYFRSIIAKDPTNSRGYEGEGRCLLTTQDYEPAEHALKQAVRLDSSNWKAEQSLGMLYDDLGRLDDAIAAYRRALKVRPVEASVLNNLGVAYYLKKNYPESIETLERALRTTRAEDRKRVYNNLGRAYARSGSYPRAIDAFRRASDLPTAYNNVGVLLLEQDNARGASVCFQRAIQESSHYYAEAHDNLAAAQDRSRGAGSGGTSPCQ